MAQPTTAAGSSSSSFYSDKYSIISGHFGIIDLSTDMVDNFIDEIASHIENAEKSANEQLQQSAEGIPGWDRYAKFLEVEVNRGDVSISSTATGKVAREIINLEFGTPEEPPVPFVRMSADPISGFINSYVNSEVRKDIPLA